MRSDMARKYRERSSRSLNRMLEVTIPNTLWSMWMCLRPTE